MPGPWDTVLTLPHQTTWTRRKRGLCIKFGFQERGFCILIGLVQDSLQELQVSLFLFPSLFQGTTGDWVTHQVLRACARIAVLKNNILDIYRLSYCRWKSGVSVAPGVFSGNQRWEKCERCIIGRSGLCVCRWGNCETKGGKNVNRLYFGRAGIYIHPSDLHPEVFR